jgi:hypothetical protein
VNKRHVTSAVAISEDGNIIVVGAGGQRGPVNRSGGEAYTVNEGRAERWDRRNHEDI